MMQEKYVDSTFAKIYYKESFRLLVFTAEDKPPHPPPPPPPPPPPSPPPPPPPHPTPSYGTAVFKNTSVC